MSFVKKALKKVWNVTKKIVKSKVFKYVAIAAAVFFTAGVAAGGFAAFGAAAGNAGIGGFFTAVGQTMATGAAAMAGAVGMTGASSTMAGFGGQAAAAAHLAGAPALMGAAASGATTFAAAAAPLATSAPYAGGASSLLYPAAETALASPVLGAVTATSVGNAALGVGAETALSSALGAGVTAAPSAGGGVWSTIQDLLGKKVLGDVTGGQLIANAGMAGVKAVLSSEANKKEYPNSFVAGGLGRGGPAKMEGGLVGTGFGLDAGAQPTTPDGMAGDPSVAKQFAQEGLAPQPQGDAPPPDPFQGARNGIDSIRARLAQRDKAKEQEPEQQSLVSNMPQSQQQPFQPFAGPNQHRATQIGGLV